MGRVLLVFGCCAALLSAEARAGNKVETGKTEAAIGRKVESFTLSDYRGKAHSLKDVQGSKGTVIAFLGTECPLAKLYAPRLAKLAKSHGEQGVAFVGVMSNRQDSVTEIAAFARVHDLEFPLLKDLGNKLADQLGAARTPEVFLVDAQGAVRYHGRVDDQYGVGTARKNPQRNDLELAIGQLLAGQPIEVAETAPVGCFIGRVREPKASSDVTYSNQIARIFQKRCVECHREGEIGPFAMTKYDEVAGWADTIAEVVHNNRMPPWHADPRHGSFLNARGLPDDEKAMIFKWAEAGAPEGDPKQLPAPRTYVTGWQLPREPDQVIYMRDEPFTVPAEGTVAYQHFMVDPGFKEDKWVKVAELIPSNRAVVHHILVFVRPPGSGERARGGDGSLGFFAAYVPGFRPQPYPDGMAKRIPAGSKLVFQMHYTPNGTPQKDRSKLGLVFADPKEITHMVKTVEAIQQGFEIPAHADNHEVVADSSPYEYDLQLISLAPHMHLRGKSFSYEARYPDGRKEMLLDVPHYDFNWQTTYLLSEFKPFPKGTSIHCIAHYDNSENNLANPDPSKVVRWGDQTWEEMMIGFYDVAIKLDQKDVLAGKIPDISPSADWQASLLLNRFDRNKDGKVTQDEMPARAQGLFLMFDTNHDGVVTRDEVVQVVKQQRAGKPQTAGGRPDAATETLKGVASQLRNVFRGAKKPDAEKPKPPEGDKKPDAPAPGKSG